MHVIPSSAQAAYDQASLPCKLAAPRIAASLDDMPLSVLCDPDRGTLEAVEFCGLHASETSFVELEVSNGRFSNCQFLSCDWGSGRFPGHPRQRNLTTYGILSDSSILKISSFDRYCSSRYTLRACC